MSYTVLGLALALACVDWVAVGRQTVAGGLRRWKTVEYIAKPGVMLALVLWLVTIDGLSGRLVWFAAGLGFSLAGDVFLMLPREQFVAGLLAFLLAHLAYVIGFNAAPPPFNLASLLLAVLVATTALRLYRTIAAGLRALGQQQLRLPVLIYSLVISLMLLSALLTLVRPEWAALPAWLVSAGATLFFISDASLAWNRFVRPLRRARLLVMITYHLGQVLLISGAALHYLR